MHWQDIVISVGAYVFILALFPSVFGSDKPAFSSSALTGTILAIYVIVYVSLGLWSSAIATGLLAVTWLVLAFQKWRHDRTLK